MSNAENITYWAFIPNLPLSRIVTWPDNPVNIYTNDYAWVPGPHDKREPLKPSEEGQKIKNYTVGTEGPPICFCPDPHCLKIHPQGWLAIVKDESGKASIYLLQGGTFNYTVVNISEKHMPNLPPCTQKVMDSAVNWMLWENCRGEIGRVLLNTPYGSIIDWSLMGSACSDKSLLSDGGE